MEGLNSVCEEMNTYIHLPRRSFQFARLRFMLLIILVLSSFGLAGLAQGTIADSSSEPAIKRIVAFYNTSLGADLQLFNGREYQDYNFRFSEGHPYFFTNKWSKGTITYRGSTYEDVSILYNLITDNVIILDYSGLSKIQLVKEKVTSFSVAGHTFINICRDSLLSSGLRCGFYDVLATGKITLLVKRTKNIQEVTTETVQIKALPKDYFYIGHNSVYSPVSKEKTLLELLSDGRNEIKRFIKQHKIRYAQNPEEAIVKIVTYYNQIMQTK